MVDLNRLSPVALKAAMTGGTAEWGVWGSALKHQRYAQPVQSRLRCRHGCKTRVTHAGMANGVGLTSGCKEHVMRWVQHPSVRVKCGDDQRRER